MKEKKQLTVWQEFLFGIQRQPDGRWPENEGWSSLFAMWCCRISLASLGLMFAAVIVISLLGGFR